MKPNISQGGTAETLQGLHNALSDCKYLFIN